jgi:hypothetical protein
MIPASLKERLVQYFLIALIIGFFLLPVATFGLFDCKIFAAKRIASLLLFFFR